MASSFTLAAVAAAATTAYAAGRVRPLRRYLDDRAWRRLVESRRNPNPPTLADLGLGEYAPDGPVFYGPRPGEEPSA